MKKVVLGLILVPIILFGTTPHEIEIDGSNDFTTSEEQFSSTSGTSLYGYITWDASYIYFGVSGASPAGTVTDGNRVYHIYLDTDPHTTPTTGNGTTDGETWRWDPTLPFNADYHYVFKTIDNSEIRRKYDSGWTDVVSGEMTTSNWKGSGYWEMRMERSTIGSPSQIYVVMYVEEDWAVNSYICGGVPSSLFTNTTTQGAITLNSHWLGFNLTTGVTPNDASNQDQSLPVTLESFTGKVSRAGVELAWATSAEIENAGFIIRRQEAGSRRQETGIREE
jgi:hypothetical protein